MKKICRPSAADTAHFWHTHSRQLVHSIVVADKGQTASAWPAFSWGAGEAKQMVLASVGKEALKFWCGTSKPKSGEKLSRPGAYVQQPSQVCESSETDEILNGLLSICVLRVRKSLLR